MSSFAFTTYTFNTTKLAIATSEQNEIFLRIAHLQQISNHMTILPNHLFKHLLATKNLSLVNTIPRPLT